MNGEAAAHAPATPPAALTRLFVKYCLTALLVGSILRFVSGRSDWSRAWWYLGLLFAGQSGAGLWLARVRPDLMAERSRIQKGTKPWDKVLAPLIAFIGPAAIWWTAAADVRANWPPPVPLAWSLAGFAACAFGFVLTLWAMGTNRFFSATVRIQSDRGQVVVDRGPYARVRHPGYTGALVFTLASPIALGSWIALVPALLTGAVLALRTALEDRTLRTELAGYADYSRRVRWRLAPRIW